MATKKKATSTDEKVAQILKEAEKKGLLNNLLFEELLNDFVYQKNILERLKRELDGSDTLLAKEYVKGKPSLVVNNCISAYNATSNAMCNTVTAMAKIVRNFGDSEADSADPLAKVLGGKK